MNILVIGNGFDLAHGLPTKYADFLEFVKTIKIIKEKNIFNDGFAISNAGCNADNRKLHQDIRLTILNKANNNKLEEDSKELLENIDHNFWIDYFLQCNMHGKENWIDFECKISEVIKSLDNDLHKLSGDYSIDDNIMDLSNEFLNISYSDYTSTTQSVNSVTDGTCESITFRDIRNKLLEDLNRLIRAFEIYLTQYVERIDCELVSPDIQRILPKESMKISGISVYDTYVLSFNYTNTYQRLYIDKIQGKNFETNIDYIHGKADINHTIETNNMVLGIDEYLSDDRKNKDVEFIAFKKYYQRIYKQTGCKYKEWVDGIKQGQKEAKNYYTNSSYTQISFDEYRRIHKGHNLYIFGHSLDTTDKDILRDLILNDNVYTTIYYHDKDAMEQQIANLVKVIGQDELIKRTGGSTKTIEFRLQKPMELIKNSNL